MVQSGQTGWERVGRDSVASAKALGLAMERIRSLVSRAYFAAYSMVTHRLTEVGIRGPQSRPNPSHASLYRLVRNNLTALHATARRDLSQAIRRLRQRRVIADYDLACRVSRDFGLESLRDLAMIQRILGFANGH